MMAQHVPTLCPHCGKDDRIQRARAYPHPHLAPPIYVEIPKLGWQEPNKLLRFFFVVLLMLALGLLVISATQTGSDLVWVGVSGGVAFALALTLLGVMRARRRAALRQYEQAVGVWTQRTGAERRRWQIAYTRWENDLFYCHRDDIVFFRGSPGVVPTQMASLLY